MKKILFIILILAFQTAFSQTPPVTVLSQKWYEKVDLRILHGNDPFSAANAEIAIGPQTSPSRQTAGGVRTNKSFAYETTIRNESKQNIIGLAWDYVFFDGQGTIERDRRKFIYLRKIKKDKKETLVNTTASPPQMVLNAKDFERENAKPKEAIEINCVVFEDGTTWKGPGVAEKVCEDLRIKIKSREKRLKRYE